MANTTRDFVLNQGAYDHLNKYATSPEENKRLAEEAKRFIAERGVTLCPYREPKRSMLYNRKRRRQYLFTLSMTSAGVGAADIKSMDNDGNMRIIHRVVATGNRERFTPEFAANDELLRLVIAQTAYSYVINLLPGKLNFYGGSPRVPNGFVLNLDALEKLVREAEEEMKHSGYFKGKEVHIRANERWGYIKLRAGIAYGAWRLGRNQSDLSAQYGVSTEEVRQILQRLVKSGRRLGLPTFERHWTTKFHRDGQITAAEMAAKGIDLLSLEVDRSHSAKCRAQRRRAKAREAREKAELAAVAE